MAVVLPGYYHPGSAPERNSMQSLAKIFAARKGAKNGRKWGFFAQNRLNTG
jgi:hypothetical protein